MNRTCTWCELCLFHLCDSTNAWNYEKSEGEHQRRQGISTLSILCFALMWAKHQTQQLSHLMTWCLRTDPSTITDVITDDSVGFIGSLLRRLYETVHDTMYKRSCYVWHLFETTSHDDCRGPRPY